jgi:hypothetical protein
MTVWVVLECREYRTPSCSCEAAVCLIAETRAEAEAFARKRVEASLDDPPDAWFVELAAMTFGVPLTAREERVIINRRGERAEHPQSLDTRFAL